MVSQAPFPADVLPENHRLVCPNARRWWARAAAGGIAFPRAFAGGHRESTTRANKLSHLSRVSGFSNSRFWEGILVEVQIFGVKKSADTRKALRFFAERRIKTHFVDLMERPAALGELRRFAQKFGVTALVDRESRRFDELGLRYAQLSDERWLEKLSEEPLLLRMPLVRNANHLVIGTDEPTWKSWMEKK